MKDSYKDLTYAELIAKRTELRKKALDHRINRVLGHVDNPLEIRTLRRGISRLNTIIHEFGWGKRVQK